eukprot:11205396-Lingulodinium_polyedra.AAC.1
MPRERRDHCRFYWPYAACWRLCSGPGDRFTSRERDRERERASGVGAECPTPRRTRSTVSAPPTSRCRCSPFGFQ